MSDASTNEEFYARLGIDPPVKASFQKTLAEAAERELWNADLMRRVNATTQVKTTAAPLR